MRRAPKIWIWVTILACRPGLEVCAQEAPETRFRGTAWLKKADVYSAARQIDSAIFAYQEACSLLAEENARCEQAKALSSLGYLFLNQGRYDEALAPLENALRLEEENKECSTLDRARTRNWLGYSYMVLEQWKKSRDLVEAGLTMRISELGPDDPAVASSQYMLGVILYKLGDYKGATVHLQEALRIQSVQPGQESSVFASTLVALGMTSSDRGDFQAALRSLSRAAEILAKINDARGGTVGACYCYLANAYAALGERTQALMWAKKSLNVYSQNYGQFHSELAGTYAALGKIHGANGDYDQAEDCFRQSMNLLTAAFGDYNSRVGQVEWMLGNLYLNKHDLGGALRYSLQALAHMERSLGSEHPDVVSLFTHIGSIYREKNENDSAMMYLDLALTGQKKIGNQIERPDLAEIYTTLGLVHTQAGRLDSALTCIVKSLDIQGESENQDPLLLSRTHRALAELLAEKHLYSAALRSYQRAYDILNPESTYGPSGSKTARRGGAYGRETLDILRAEGKTYQKLAATNSADTSPLLTALSVYTSAGNLVERLRGTYAREGSKFLLAEESLPLFEQGIRVSMDLFRLTGAAHYKQLAFSFAERSKAGILFDGIRRTEARRYSGIPDSLLEREHEISGDIIFCENQLERSGSQRDPSTRTAIQERLFGLYQQKASIEERIDQTYPVYQEARYGDSLTTVHSIQQVLDNSTSLLSYFVGDSAIWIFAIGRESFDVVTVPKVSDFEVRVHRARKALRAMDRKAYPSDAYALYQMLMRPIENSLGDRQRLIIIPDGCLYYVPFEALVTALPAGAKNPSGGWEYTSLPFLIRSREISYAHSARLYAHFRDRETTHTKETLSFLGFAPVFRDTTQVPSGPPDKTLLASNDLSGLRSLTVNGKKFRELKYSEEEVRQIAAGFQSRGYPGVAYIHSDATKETFRRNAGAYRYIHLATHGYIDEDHPSLSALVFTPQADALFSDDGLLYAGEAYNLQLDAELLVLSSCESGVGKMARGEGVLAFTRGFQYAGARNIIYSLWKVLDKQTKELMQEFYGGVLNGKRVSQALREAKLKMVRNHATAFPLLWAGFVLLGE
jgi:CHAT domain-containing protein/Tfp pilus assembly protein PilF